MLSEKPWRPDAILRLVVSVLMCMFIGTLAMSSIRYLHGGQKNPILFLLATAAASGFFAGALWLLRRPLSAEKFGRQFLALLLCIYAGLCLMWISGRLSGPVHSSANEVSLAEVVISSLSIQGALLALVPGFLRQHQIGFSEAFGLKFGWKKALLFGVILVAVFWPVGRGLQAASVEIMRLIHLEPQEQILVQLLRATETWRNRLLLGAVAVLIAPVAEEILFRGILYPAIKQRGFPGLALWSTSLLFGVIHFNLPSFLPLVVLSLVLTWLYEETDNLLAPIATHSIFNAANFAALYYMQSKFGQS
jgi:membrane protease YdiL (CAAX protease family)